MDISLILHGQRALRRQFMPLVVIPNDGILEEIERQSKIQSEIKKEVDEMYYDLQRNGELDFETIADNLSYLGDDYLDCLYYNLVNHYSLYQHGYSD